MAAFDEEEATLTDEQIEAIFQEFDISGDGFIDLDELVAALSRLGRPVSTASAEDILRRVDTNNDGQISLDEFKAVFRLAPSAVPDALRGLVDVRTLFVDGLGRVGTALGIEVSGQWRTTDKGSRYVDDIIGEGKPVVPGDFVKLHYTTTLLSNNQVVETSRGGLPVGFEIGEIGEANEARPGWNDAVSGMRIGGKRRVYASPSEGEGPNARYDIEVVDVEDGPRSAQEGVIASLGGRRAVARLLFALTFAPYFLPEDFRPAFFSPYNGNAPPPPDVDAEGKVDRSDRYVASQLDALFSQEVLPPKR